MKTKLLFTGFFFIFLQITAKPDFRRENLFDSDWRFYRGGAQGAERKDFNDSEWRVVDLPHDWSIEDLPGTESPFSINAISQVSGGFTTGGTGWYRKTFNITNDFKNQRFMILFEGIYMNSEVWINGQYLGGHPYGYSSFWFDITSYLIFDGDNVLCVKVKNEGENSRWYSGSGIYRHVWLYVLPPIHTMIWGVNVTTPQILENKAQVNIKTTVVNESKYIGRIKVVSKIIDKTSNEVGRNQTLVTIESGENIQVEQKIYIKDPYLWSTNSPQLYKVNTEIYENEILTDITVEKFGIRWITLDTAGGFQLNGKTMKLKGGCIHHDNGPLGAKAYDRAEERRVELLKASGFNSVRCCHNPPSPAFLDACDRIGLMVIDESFDMWGDQKNPFDYHIYFIEWWKLDIKNMVIRDRNHPSVILWSIGNEIPGGNKSEVVETARKLASYIRTLDKSRPVTSAVNNLRPDMDQFFATLDIAGYNYAAQNGGSQQSPYILDHNRVPERIMYGSESYSQEAFLSWMNVVDNKYIIGDFVWTAFDYIGEASIGWRGYWQKQNFFPWNLAYCGDIDICGWKRPQSFYRDALWKENQLSIWVTPPVPSFEPNLERQPFSKWNWFDAVNDWSWQGYEGKTLEVVVYSSCEEVELQLNGKSLGKKSTNRSTRFIASWKVPYQPGTLRAIGYSERKKVSVSELASSGEPVDLRLTADKSKIKADGQDLCYVTVELIDGNGMRSPKAEDLVMFDIEGPGAIIAVGNANPVSAESYQLPHRKAWHGRCLVIIKSEENPGKITLKAHSPGLAEKSLDLFSN